MTKVGRNDPCHCGSGKKYKKCCQEKDEQKVVDIMISERDSEEWEQEDELELPFFSDNEENDDFFLNPEEDDDLDDEDDEPWQSNKPYPEISEEDEKLVDEWWEKYKNIDDKSTDEIRIHIESFMNFRPDLVENLGMEHEVLFELGANYKREGRLDEYISLLLKVRAEFFSTYKRSAKYYSTDVIAWLLHNNKLDEIDTYLDDFTINYDNSYEQIEDLIHLFLAIGKPELAHSFTDKIIQHLKCQDREPEMGEEEIILPWVIKTQSKYLKPDYTDKDITDFIQDITSKAPNAIPTDIEFWKELFNEIFKPFEPWQETIPKKKSQIDKYYRAIGHNYMRYLHEIKGASWESAHYFSKHIYSYLATYVETSKGKIRHLFDFSPQKLDELIGRISQEYIFLNPVTAFSLFNTVYHFVSYLQHCGNIDEKKMELIQADCKSLKDKFYSNLSKSYPEALCFEKFPVWG